MGGWILHKDCERLDLKVFARVIKSSYPEFSVFSSQIFLLTYITTFEPETPAGHPKYQKTRIVA